MNQYTECFDSNLPRSDQLKHFAGNGYIHSKFDISQVCIFFRQKITSFTETNNDILMITSLIPTAFPSLTSP